MTKSEKIKKRLENLRRIVAEHPSPIFKMSKEKVIKKLRETREAIWEQKIAHHN